MSDQECPVEVCDRRIPLDKLMCRGHWFLVPTPIQRKVYRAWSKRQRLAITHDGREQEYRQAVEAHRAVKDEAVAAVEERLAR